MNIFNQSELITEKPDSNAVTQMEVAIMGCIAERGAGTSYVELERIDGFGGDVIHGNSGANVVFWLGVSLVALEALRNLINSDRIVPKATGALVYLIDGRAINLPVARSLEPRKSTAWLPVVYSLPEQISAKPAGRKSGGG